MTPRPATYPGYRFPAGIISHAAWLYHVFSLSLRDVELILAERSIGITHESIRQWCLRFGADFARKLRRRRPRPCAQLASPQSTRSSQSGQSSSREPSAACRNL